LPVAEVYETSLHMTVAGFRNYLDRMAPEPGALDAAFEGNCAKCHATCGECHVTRPRAVDGGLIAGHAFLGSPPMETTCYSCHGMRNAGEFMGEVGWRGDVHYTKAGMDCMGCHSLASAHGSGVEYGSMWEVEHLPSCLDCHPNALPGKSSNAFHNAHDEDLLACWVCHAQANNNCFSCHLQPPKDGKMAGVSETRLLFRIGLNPDPSPRIPWTYITLRHMPTLETTFTHAGVDSLPLFDEVANWKFSPTHNLQRYTPQNETCNSCHGNPRIFLREEDLRPGDSKANQDLLVPRIPAPR